MNEAGKYFKPTLKYLKSKGLPLFMLTILPSLFTAFLISPSSMLYFLCDFKNLGTYDFETMYLKMYNFNSQYYYIGIIGVFLYVFVIAILFGSIDRHMRIGEFTISFRRAKTRLNYNFLTALKAAFIVVLVYEIYNVVNVAFSLLWARTFADLTTALVFSVISFVLTSFAMTVAFSALLLWSPFMLHTGLSTFEAFKIGLRQNKGNIMRTTGIMIVCVLPIMLFMLLDSLLGWGSWIRILLDGIALAFMAVLYVVLMYTVFYDVTGTERMDLQNINIWSKK